nr:aminotransferase class I/II-fold pyridoxal phosphate-dependent enzyme [Rhodospirillum rubrum]
MWHGGAIAAARARFGDPGPQGWLDLSTGIAPIAYPYSRLPVQAWTRLPDSDLAEAFIGAVRAAHHLPAVAAVLPIAGEQAILGLLPLCNAPSGAVCVPKPGYRGHAEAWAAAGRLVHERADPLETAGEGGVIVVINPNNPSGRRWSAESLLVAASAQAAAGGWLIVDEAFGEVTPDLSVLAYSGRPGLLVLRSFGKFFGLPGLRLGWLAGPPEVVGPLALRLGPWAVSGPALALGARAEADELWRAGQRRRLARLAVKLDGVLSRAGLVGLGGTDLFRLVEVPAGTRALDWFEGLAAQGILVRPFADAERALRFGLPGTQAARDRLAAGLARAAVK